MKRIDISTKKYPNIFVLVDDANFEFLNQWKWFYVKNGYATRTIYIGKVNGKYKYERVYMHQLVNKTPKGFPTDHINRNTLDNRKKNLRTAYGSINQINCKKAKNNTSGYKGILWHKRDKKWMANIRVNCKLIHLGYFTDIEEAVSCRKEAEKAYYQP